MKITCINHANRKIIIPVVISDNNIQTVEFSPGINTVEKQALEKIKKMAKKDKDASHLFNFIEIKGEVSEIPEIEKETSGKNHDESLPNISEMTPGDARKVIEEQNDIRNLTALLNMEKGRNVSRSTVLNAITAQMQAITE